MSNVAYADFGAIKAPVERKVAELEDGYAKLSNMLLEAYAGADLTKRQFKVLLAILRKTYGWNKAMDRISDSQIAEIAKLPVKRCNETKLQLVRMGLIKQQGGMFGPNKNINEWCIPQNRGTQKTLFKRKKYKIKTLCLNRFRRSRKNRLTSTKKQTKLLRIFSGVQECIRPGRKTRSRHSELSSLCGGKKPKVRQVSLQSFWQTISSFASGYSSASTSFTHQRTSTVSAGTTRSL